MLNLTTSKTMTIRMASLSMPAQDRCHAAMVNALKKQGWRVTHDPYPIRWHTGMNYVFADLRLQYAQNGKTSDLIVVEVKCFAEKSKQLQDLYQSVGQFQFYRQSLKVYDLGETLYLAVPLSIYETLFALPTVMALFREIQIKFVVVDLDKEEIVEWVTVI